MSGQVLLRYKRDRIDHRRHSAAEHALSPRDLLLQVAAQLVMLTSDVRVDRAIFR
jgi:hypothetical protein